MKKTFNIQKWLIRIEIFFSCLLWITEQAVVAPPWADPKLNPCASQPRGWQLLYWPPDGKCYKIFQVGHPCPEGMELSPSAASSTHQLSAECRCPPKTAQSARDGRCYELYTIGPCDKGFYFAPDTQYKAKANSSSKRQWGVCNQMKKCPHPNEIFWPQNGHCYLKLSKGPCPRGQLITLTADKLAACKCNNKLKELRDYRYEDGNCYQHFTRGPCREKGHLFLPDRSCGCHSFLPHYHEDSQKCFELGTIGPCGSGETFHLHPESRRGMCQCKKGNIRYESNGACYRPFTQGPCETGNFLINTTTCIEQPCARGYLYFPQQEECYRIGTTGPCPKGQLVTFDFETRPSIDGISFNGVCSCDKYVYNKCENTEIVYCDRNNGMVRYGNRCYKLYTQGPCVKGAWLVPRRTKRQEMLWAENEEKQGVCECMPGYTKSSRTFNGRIVTECVSPTVILADYLNKNFSIVAQNTF